MDVPDADRLWLDIVRAARSDANVRAALAAAYNAHAEARARGVPLDQVIAEIERLADDWRTR